MKCTKCYRMLIDEELKDHVCREAKGVRIDGTILWLSDGIMEYPLKYDQVKRDLFNRKFTPNKNNRRFDRTR